MGTTDDKFYQEIVNNIPGFVFQLRYKKDGTTVWNHINKKGIEMLGMPEDIVGKEWKLEQRVVEEHRKEFLESIGLSVTALSKWEHEFLYNHPDGTQIWLHGIGTPTRNGDETKINGVVLDITVQKEQEFLIRDSEEKFRSLYSDTPAMMHSIDRNGRIISVSNQWLKVLGYRSDEVIGRESIDFLTTESKKYVVEVAMPTLFKAGFIDNIELQFKRKDGKLRDVLLSAITEKDASGLVYQSLAVLNDITKAKKAERNRERSEVLYKTLFQGAGDAIMVVKDSIIIDCNKKTCKIFGYKSKSEIVGNTVWFLSPEKQEDGINSEYLAKEILNNAVKNKPAIFEWKHLKADGTEFDAEVNLIKIDLNNVPHIFAIIRDISEGKKAKNELKENRDRFQKLLNSTIQGLAWFEFKSPMNLKMTLEEQISWVMEKLYVAGCNNSFANMYGYKNSEEVEGESCLVLWAGEETAKVIIEQYITGGYEWKNLETKEITKEGGEKFFLNNLNSVFNSKHEIEGLWVSQIDITDLKVAQDAMQKNDERLQLATQAVNLACYDWLPLEGEVHWDKQMHQMFGLSLRSNVNRMEYLTSLIHPDDKDRINAEFENSMDPKNKKTLFKYEFKVMLKQEQIIHIELQALHFRDDKGVNTRIFGVCQDITERKLAEEELTKSKSILSEAQRIGNIGSWEYDIVTNTSVWSAEIYRIFGLDPFEIEATFDAYVEYTHPEDRKMVIEAYNDSVENRTPYDIVHRLRLEDSTIKYVSERCETFYDDDGKPIRSIGLVQDITRGKQAEKAMLESERRYHSVIDAMTEGIILQLADGTIQASNASAEQILGLTTDQMMGRTSMDPRWRSIHEDGSPFPADTYPSVVTLQTGKPCSNVIMGVHKPEGILSWIAINSSPMFKENETLPYAVVSSYTDITEPIQTDKALKESEKKFRTIFENSRLGNSMTGVDGTLNINKAFADILGYTEKELKKKHWKEITHPDDLEESETIVNSLLAGETDSAQYEKRYKHKKGHFIWTEVNTTLLKDSDDKPLFFFTSISDISQRKDNEEKIENYQKNLEQLVEERTQEVKKLSQAVEQSPASVVITDINGDIEYVNPYFTTLTGYSSEEVMGRNPRFMNATGLNKSYYKSMWDSILNGKNWNGEFINKKKNGELFTESIAVSPIFDEAGNITNFVAVKRDITEDKKLQQELMIFKFFADTSSQGFGMADLNGRIYYMNKSLCELYRVKQTPVGEPFFMFYKDESLKLLTEEIIPATISNGNWQGELDLHSVHGNIVPAYHNFFVIKDEGGQPIRLATIITDITKRKQIEEELLQFKSFADTTTEGFGMAELDGRILYQNKALNDLLDEKETPCGSALIKYFAPESKGLFKNEIEKSLINKGAWQGEVVLNSAKGNHLVAYMNLFFLKNDSGIPERMAAVIQDITRRKQIEEELQKAKQEAELLNKVTEIVSESQTFELGLKECLDAICSSTQWPVGHVYIPLLEGEEVLIPTKIWHFDDEKAFSTFRNVTEKTVFKKGEGLPGRIWESEQPNWIYNVHKDKNFPRNTFVKDLGVKGAFGFPIIINHELEAVCEFFTTIEIEPNEQFLQSMMSVSNQIGRVFERNRNAEELKKAKDEAESANRAKSTFLANMSHEIRTPMNSVLGFAEILSGKITDPKHKSYLKSIQSSGKSLLTLINDILDLSKVESGKLELSYDSLRVEPFFNDIINIFRLKIEEKGLNFQIDIDADLPLGIHIDELRLRQIIINLLGNAVKFTDKGYIRFSVRQESQTKDAVNLIILVEDTGIGISKTFLSKLFDTFQQEDGQISRKYGGTGLGLAISRRLAKVMNGDIKVSSKRGQGSEFTLILKQVKISHEAVEVAESELIRPDQVVFQGSQILIVDDSEEIRKYFVEVLSDTNLKTMLAENGKKALQKAKKTVPDLIITDLKMPVMDGFELVETLKREVQLKEVPIIAVTASVMKENISKIQSSKFDGFLIKPVQMKDLYAELLKFLPHEILEIEPEELLDAHEDISLTYTKKDIIEITDKLEDEFLEKWSKFKITQPMNDVQGFATQLKELGNELNVEPIRQYGDQLLNAINNFDIENMQRILKEFPKIIDKLKSFM